MDKLENRAEKTDRSPNAEATEIIRSELNGESENDDKIQVAIQFAGLGLQLSVILATVFSLIAFAGIAELVMFPAVLASVFLIFIFFTLKEELTTDQQTWLQSIFRRLGWV